MSINISHDEFNAIRALIHKVSGIYLSSKKQSLVINRLGKILVEKGFKTFSEYYDYLKRDSKGQGAIELINKISTNHTYFNRENTHFDFLLSRALPEVVEKLKKERSNDLRIWCAACSSGEEAYMLAIILREFFGKDYSLWDGGLLATDISQNALNKAKEGIFLEERLSKMPQNLKQKYFMKTRKNTWKVSDAIRHDITFRRFNLISHKFPFKKPFQVIFCRNVMIYFDKNTRDSLVDKFYSNTIRGGYLFIGHSETIDKNNSKYDYVMPAVFKKAEVV